MGDADLLDRVIEARAAYYEIGQPTIDVAGSRFIHNPALPILYDANMVSRANAATPDEIEALLARVEEEFAGSAHRRLLCSPRTPPVLEARLALDDYTIHPRLELLLESELHVAAPAVAIRPVETDDDWDGLAVLTRRDNEEEAAREGRPPVSADFAAQYVAFRRAKAPALQFWLARVDGADCAFFSSWPGCNGVGVVEDLFTDLPFRGRGIATALIVHAVADARARGAGPVLIGALPHDTPKHIYARLGFRPFCVRRVFQRTSR